MQNYFEPNVERMATELFAVFLALWACNICYRKVYGGVRYNDISFMLLTAAGRCFWYTIFQVSDCLAAISKSVAVMAVAFLRVFFAMDVVDLIVMAATLNSNCSMTLCKVFFVTGCSN